MWIVGRTTGSTTLAWRAAAPRAHHRWTVDEARAVPLIHPATAASRGTDTTNHNGETHAHESGGRDSPSGIPVTGRTCEGFQVGHEALETNAARRLEQHDGVAWQTRLEQRPELLDVGGSHHAAIGRGG